MLRIVRTFVRQEDAYSAAALDAALDKEYHRWREVGGGRDAVLGAMWLGF